MGSLTSGWDSTGGKPPKGFEDFAEPISPRSITRAPASSFKEDSAPRSPASGPPNLARTSAPPMHGAAAVERYLSGASSTAAPGSPRSAKHHLTLKCGDGDDDQALLAKEKWCSRVESAGFNLRPDECDQDAWRHGSFKLDDSYHVKHFPTAATAAAAQPHAAAGAEPVTPPPAAIAASHPKVTVTRVPAGAGSLESLGQ